jgi:hypothetical protein
MTYLVVKILSLCILICISLLPLLAQRIGENILQHTHVRHEGHAAVFDHAETKSHTRTILEIRHASLKRLALYKKKIVTSQGTVIECPKDRLFLTEFQFGRTGNNVIEFTHGLWLAEKMNATLVIPQWMKHIFLPFNTSILDSIYCYTMDVKIPDNANKYELTSEESFFIHQVFRQESYLKFFPYFSHFQYQSTASSEYRKFVDEFSKHFLQVYAALWCNPIPKLLYLAEVLIDELLNGRFGYSAVHKRQLEGGCNKIMLSVASKTDFNPKEIPHYNEEWNNPKVHPICEMNYPFVKEILILNSRNNSPLFVAHDGRGDISEYLNHHAVFSKDITAHLKVHIPESAADESAVAHKAFSSIDADTWKFVDMLVAIHAEFFILNPRSTFSWQIYLIRLCLGLESVPIIQNNDFYMQKIPEELMKGNRSVWVSWTSVLTALSDLH